MKKNNIILLIVILGFMIPLSGFADTLSLDAVSKAAIFHSVVLQKQALVLKAQEADIQDAYGDILPKLDTRYAANYTDYSIDGRDALADVVIGGDSVSVYPVSPSKYKSGLDVMLTQTVYAGGRILANIDMHKLSYEREVITYELLREKVVAEALEKYWAFYSASLDEQFYHFCKSGLAEKKKSADLQREMGRTSHSEDLETELAFLNTEQDLKQARTVRQRCEAELQEVTHLQTALEWATPNLQSLAQLNKIRDQLFKSVSENRLETKQDLLDFQVKQKAQVIEDSRFYPEVTIQTGVNYFNADQESLGTAMQNLKYGAFYAEVVVKWNLFNGFKDVAQSKKASLQREAALLESSQHKRDYTVSIKQLAMAVDTALSQVQRMGSQQRLAKRVKQNAWDRQKIGGTSSSVLFEAEKTVKKAELNEQKAILEAQKALMNWSKATHQLDLYLQLNGASE